MVQHSTSPVHDPLLERMLALSLQTQEAVCSDTGRIDGTAFRRFETSGTGGNGRYHSLFRVALLEHSRLFEKASFVVSNNWGQFSRTTEQMAREGTSATDFHFHATGFSMVFHPSHPKIPSTRIHYHMIQREDGYYWFSGGGDLTPCYVFPEDCRHFHQVHKRVCDAYLGAGWYARMKDASDAYFNVRHRGHIRGIGGTFFDDFNDGGFGKDRQPTGLSKASLFAFVEASCQVNRGARHDVESVVLSALVACPRLDLSAASCRVE